MQKTTAQALATLGASAIPVTSLIVGAHEILIVVLSVCVLLTVTAVWSD